MSLNLKRIASALRQKSRSLSVGQDGVERGVNMAVPNLSGRVVELRLVLLTRRA